MGVFILGFQISAGEKTSNEIDKGLSILPTEEIILQKHLAGSVPLTTVKNIWRYQGRAYYRNSHGM